MNPLQKRRAKVTPSAKQAADAEVRRQIALAVSLALKKAEKQPPEPEDAEQQ